MKKMIKNLSFLLFGLMIVSCSDSMEEFVESNMLENAFQEIKKDNHVTYDNIVALCKGQNGITRASVGSSFDIDCILSEDKDTLLYVCSKRGGGWTIYSSDTRVPAIIAQSDEGSFETLMQNENARIWIQAIAEDLQIIKTLDDDKLNFSKEDIERNKSFWSSISSPDLFLKEMQKQNTTRAIGDEIIPPGHFELVESTTYSEVYDSIGSLTTTDWHQNPPYNMYCPKKSSGNDRAPAGCVAIAGAQMLYFLHDYFGVPEEAPSAAYCNGTVNDYPNYDWAQYNYNTSIWAQMNTYGNFAAPLIADVGRRVNMEYGNNSSSATTSDLVNNVFAPYGISCTYDDYDVSNLKSSLLSGIPVVISARSKKYPTVFQTVGHSFIADRYKRTRTVTRNVYEWVYDFIPPEGGPLPLVPGEVEYTYSSPVISMIGMNWGWGYNPSNEWYSLTGDWYKVVNGNLYNFNISRHMIYNFHVTND